MTTKTSLFVLWGLLLALAAPASPRAIPQPLPHHPGNVFLAGETITLSLPQAGDWQLVDYDHKLITTGSGKEASLGKLATGYYELQLLTNGAPSNTRITLGVVTPLKSPTPESSPIGIDVAMAWFYSGEQQAESANLCSLAGMNWVRDRLSWEAMEPVKGRFSGTNKYDDTARIQSAAGLRVLQVHHNTPAWASTNTQHQPPDLRDAYNFMREMAKRWKGQVTAFEPWNEADIEMFGGHTGVEMASLQKASYLGLKAGNPEVIACLNVFASPQRNILADLHANEASAYFDTFNLHHYCGPDQYSEVYAAFREVSDGKPLWVTEFNAPVHWKGSEQEPTDGNLHIQAERVPQVFASALHQGPVAAFYFMLPHYCEGETQFGILHKDLTPRPAFLALAAAGRLLADARPMGKIATASNARAFAFHTKLDGQPHEVVVAWTVEGDATLSLPTAPTSVYDAIGRGVSVGGSALKLTPAPIYAVYPEKALDSLALESAPKPPALKHEKPSPIVLQLAGANERVVLGLSAWKISSKKPDSLPVIVYNFSDHKISGTLSVTHPTAWIVQLPEQIEMQPGERKELVLNIDCQTGASSLVETIKITGHFGDAGEPVLSVWVTPTPFKLREGTVQAMPGVGEATRWEPLFSSSSEHQIVAENGEIHVKAKLNAGDRWAYPIFNLRPEERPAASMDAFVVTLTAHETANYRVIMDEDNGSSYAIDLLPQPKAGETVEAIGVLSAAIHGDGWSKPDDNSKLDPDKIKSLKIGCNSGGETVDYSFKNVRWIKISAP